MLVGLVTVANSRGVYSGVPVSAYVTLGALLLTAIFGVLANAPKRSLEADAAGLERLIDDDWSDNELSALETISRNRLSILRDSRGAGERMAGQVAWALRFELAAIALLAVTMWEVR